MVGRGGLRLCGTDPLGSSEKGRTQQKKLLHHLREQGLSGDEKKILKMVIR